MSSEAQRRATIAYNKRQDNIMLRPSKEEGGQIRAAAKSAGQSVQQYVLDAVRARMMQEASEHRAD